MPLYEYECDACGHRVELIQKFSDPGPATCAKCGKGPMQRLQSSPAIQFKGTGWYITDYARKGSSGGESAGSKKGGTDTPAAATADTATETKKTESAPAASSSTDAPAKS